MAFRFTAMLAANEVADTPKVTRVIQYSPSEVPRGPTSIRNDVNLDHG